MKIQRGLLIVLVIIGLIVLGGLWLVSRHTSFLSRRTANTAVTNNNFNPTINTSTAANVNATPPVDITTLVASNPVLGNHRLNIPAGFSVSIFAQDLDAPRFFAVLAPGVLVIANKGAGELVWQSTTERKVIDQNLRNVHSVAWADNVLYVGEETRITAYQNFRTDGTFDAKKVIINNLPSSGAHVTRTVVVGPDKKLYVSIGSSCNLCVEKDERRAAVMQYNIDGTGGRVFARGLRNSVGLAWQGNDLWSVDNGRDLLGDNLPPEEVNLLQDGKNYGWPYCYGDKIANPEYSDRATFCKNETAGPTFTMQAHSAPLGLAVIPSNFSSDLAGKLLIAFHGSWNRSERTGYKVVWVDPAKPNTGPTNFVTGWLASSGVWGRPVGLGFDTDGTLYISDDYADVIYAATLH